MPSVISSLTTIVDVAHGDELGARDQDDKDENEDDGREQAYAQQYFLQYSRVDVHFISPKSP